ncbi:MAG: translation initiation factor IF-2 subunit gamma [Nanoarchaeota archaeon]
MKKPDITQLETLNVIMVGHIDHGKTTLLHKLTGKWTDTHSEELKRGITIRLGYAEIVLSKGDQGYNKDNNGEPIRYVSFVDAPGHEMLMATMLSGAAIVDAAILVIAANEGIKPQTREHLVAVQAKNIHNVIIVQNKIDLVTKEQALKNYKDIKSLVKGTVAENAPIIPVSAQHEINIDKIYEALMAIPLPKRAIDAAPLFVIARSFDINKPGTTPEKLHGAVLGGTLKSGTIAVGDSIEIKPGIPFKEANQVKYKPFKTNVRSLFKGITSVQSITPGGSVSIETELDMGLGKSDLLAGCVASHTGTLPEAVSTLKMKYELFKEMLGTIPATKVEPLKTNEMIMLSINTSVSVGIIKTLKNNEAELNLRIPIVPFKGENIAIARNINNHWRLIGHGEIV